MSKVRLAHLLGLTKALRVETPARPVLMLEEDVIVPGKAAVMEGGGLMMGSLGEKVKEKEKVPGQCWICDTTISRNKDYCYTCAVKAGVAG